MLVVKLDGPRGKVGVGYPHRRLRGWIRMDRGMVRRWTMARNVEDSVRVLLNAAAAVVVVSLLSEGGSGSV